MKVFFQKVGAFFKAIGLAIVKVLTEIWAAITTEGKTIADWHLDPWKVAGLLMFILSTIGAVEIFSHLELDAGKLGILAGLVGSGITVATFLFGQAAKNDAGIRNGQ